MTTLMFTYTTGDSHCSDYDYCFDCVQDAGCGFCSDVATLVSTAIPTLGGGVYRDVCIPNNEDTDQPQSPSICASTNYHATSCPGSGLTGWLIFLFLCLYLLAFSPGMGE